MKFRQLGVLLILLFTVNSVWAEVVIGIFPRRPVVKTKIIFSPLAKILSERLNEKVVLKVPKNFQSFWALLEQGKFDVVHYNQYHYILSHEKFGYRVFAANEEFGMKELSGALVVRNDSNIKNLQDLRGKTILFGGGKKAMASYIAPTYLLKQAGLTEGKDYKVKFAMNPPNAVMGVYSGMAAASGNGSIVLQVKMITDAMDVSKVRILAKTDKFVHISWAAKSDFPKEKLNTIRNTMLGLKNTERGRRVLKSARVTGFYSVTDADFKPVRKITDYVFNH